MASIIFDPLSRAVLTAVNSASGVIQASIINDVAGLILISGTLYFTLMGYMIIGNFVQTPFAHFIKSALRFGFIVGLVLFAGAYASEIVPALQGLQVGLASAFTNSSSPLAPGTTIFNVLDDTVQLVWDLVSSIEELDRDLLDAGGAVGDYLLMALILGISIVLMAKTASYILIANVMFLIMLAIGPLFVLMLLFGGLTAQWFDRWFGQTFTYILQVALVSLVASFIIQIFNTFIPSSAALLAFTFSDFLWAGVKMLGVGLVFFVLLDEANSAAGQLAGGISSGAANLVAGAARAASPAYRALAQRSTRLQADGKGSVTRSRMGHLMQGNNSLNPAYRQRMKTVRQERHRNQYGSGKNSVKKS